MDSETVVRDWRPLAFVAAVVVLAVADMVTPQGFVLLGFLVIPIVGSVVLARPAITGVLTGLSLALALVASAVGDYSTIDVVRRLVVLGLAGLVAILLARGARSMLDREQQQSARFQLLAEHASDVVVQASRAGIIEWVSPSVSALLGWRPDDIIGRDFVELVHPDDRAGVESMQTGPQAGEPGDMELRIETAAGGWRWIAVRLRPVLAADGTIASRVAGWRDIQVEREARVALEASEERYRLLAANSSDVVVHVRDDIVQWVSPSLTPMLGWALEDWIGHDITDFWHPEDEALREAARVTIDRGDATVLRSRLLSRDGSFHWQEFHAQQYLDSAGDLDGITASFRTIDAEIAAERELDRRARIDDLTGALKRNEVLSRLNDVGGLPRRPGTERAVLFIDVDRFKHVNDTLGHGVGDEVLKALAQRIRGAVRAQDAVARMGGDEFVVILEDLHTLEEAAEVAEKIRAEAAIPVHTRDGEVRSTVSVGVTLMGSNESADELVARADDAMFRAKGRGRDRVVAVGAPNVRAGGR